MNSTLSAAGIEEVLTSQHYAHLGCAADGEVYVVPITYVYKDNVIYSYTHEGMKIDMMRKNPNVCVQMEEVKGHREWRSVICWGTYEELQTHDEQQHVRLMLAKQFAEASLRNDSIISPLVGGLHLQKQEEQALPVIYRINVTKKTGKIEHTQ